MPGGIRTRNPLVFDKGSLPVRYEVERMSKDESRRNHLAPRGRGDWIRTNDNRFSQLILRESPGLEPGNPLSADSWSARRPGASRAPRCSPVKDPPGLRRKGSEQGSAIGILGALTAELPRMLLQGRDSNPRPPA